ncbi:MAG: hypothetical protein M3Z25_02665 [Actinomycetota bacterium]|nr:hypothetical protein [Actinomycetota bacterium]
MTPPVVFEDNDQVKDRLDTLAANLIESGALRSPQWRRVFLAVRRHVFVPRTGTTKPLARSHPGGG